MIHSIAQLERLGLYHWALAAGKRPRIQLEGADAVVWDALLSRGIWNWNRTWNTRQQLAEMDRWGDADWRLLTQLVLRLFRLDICDARTRSTFGMVDFTPQEWAYLQCLCAFDQPPPEFCPDFRGTQGHWLNYLKVGRRWVSASASLKSNNELCQIHQETNKGLAVVFDLADYRRMLAPGYPATVPFQYYLTSLAYQARRNDVDTNAKCSLG